MDTYERDLAELTDAELLAFVADADEQVQPESCEDVDAVFALAMAGVQ